MGVQDAYNNPVHLGHCQLGGHAVDDRFIRLWLWQMQRKPKLDPEKVENNVEVANIILKDAGNKLKVCSDIENRHIQLPPANFRRKNLDGLKSNQEAEVSTIKRSYSQCTELGEAFEPMHIDVENVALTGTYT